MVRLADLRKPGYEKSEIHADSPFGPEPDLWFEVAGTPAGNAQTVRQMTVNACRHPSGKVKT